MEFMFYDLQRKSQKRKQYAMVIIDPHSDFAKRLLTFSHNIDRERLVYISSAINNEAGTKETYTAVINPFEISDTSDEMQNILAQELTEAISELLAETSHSLTVQMTAILRPCIATVLRCKEPSLETLARFFLDENGQNEDLIELGKTSLIPIHKQFFEHDFHSKEYVLTKRSIRTKLLYFLGEPMLANMLRGRSTVNIKECIDNGKIIIFNLPVGAGKFTSSVFSRLMIAYIQAIMLRREGMDRKKRKKCFLFIDEFQTMLTGSLADGLAQSRKYGLSMILATQSLKAIEGTTLRKNIMVNTGLKIVGLTDHEDKVTFAKEFDVPNETFTKIEPLQFVIKKNDGRQKAFTFRVPILSRRYFLTAKEKKDLLEYLVYKSGIYVKVLPPAPPTTPVFTPAPKTKQKQRSTKSNTDKDNPFDDNLKPAF